MFKGFVLFLSCFFGNCETPDNDNKTALEPIIEITAPTQPNQEENQAQAITGPLIEDLAITIPKECRRLIKYFVEFDNPVRDASQIYQESTCNQFAKSPYANGVAQITPKTGHGWARGICKNLGPYRKFDDHWQLSCFKIAMSKTQFYVNKKYPLYDYCTSRAINEQIYNGGYWVTWEIDHAGTYFKAKGVCGKVRLPNGKKRAKWACDENYSYPVYITKRQSKFNNLGGEKCYIL